MQGSYFTTVFIFTMIFTSVTDGTLKLSGLTNETTTKDYFSI